MGRERLRAAGPWFIESLLVFDPEDLLTVRQGYSAWASLYDDDGNPLIALEGPAVRSWFGPVAGCRALDLGCGTGRHTEALLDAGASSVIALDLTPEMLARAIAKLAGRPAHFLRHGFPTPLPFLPETFDLAVMGLVAEHLESLAPALGEVARVLTPGGRLILSALHPELTGEGQTARFIDPSTGLRRRITTYHRTEFEYLHAAESEGFVVEGVRSLQVPIELANDFPRAARYVGRNLGWVACWSKRKG